MTNQPRLTAQTLQVLGAFLSEPCDELTGAGIAKSAQLASGTLYPILARLELAGWLSSRWETEDPALLGRPRRRYYRLTAEGAKQTEAVRQALRPLWTGKLSWT